MKKISQYCATAALAVGLVASGAQVGNAAASSSDKNGGDLSSSSDLTTHSLSLGSVETNKLDHNVSELQEVKVAGRTGRYIALGVGAAILGSALTAHHYNRGYYRGRYYSRPYRTYYYRGSYYAPRWAKRKCARRFRSFDWYSGTYVTYSGRVRLCPYLR